MSELGGKKMSERKPFKDWFDKAAARTLASQVATAMPSFDEEHFVRLASRNLPSLEFAGRVQQFSDALAATLPQSAPKALAVLTEADSTLYVEICGTALCGALSRGDVCTVVGSDRSSKSACAALVFGGRTTPVAVGQEVTTLGG